MRRVLAAIGIVLVCAIFVGVHAHKILKLNEETAEISDRVEESFAKEDWEGVKKGLKELEERWNQSRFWACLTIETNEIEEIEISLRQSMEYAEVSAKEDFIGEFTMLRMKIEHLPHQEGFSIEEFL